MTASMGGLGPYSTRGQAEADLPVSSRTVAEDEIRQRRKLESLTDALDWFGVERGDFDREVLARIAGQLDGLDVEVLVSLIRRAAGDVAEEWMMPFRSPARTALIAARPREIRRGDMRRPGDHRRS